MSVQPVVKDHWSRCSAALHSSSSSSNTSSSFSSSSSSVSSDSSSSESCNLEVSKKIKKSKGQNSEPENLLVICQSKGGGAVLKKIPVVLSQPPLESNCAQEIPIVVRSKVVVVPREVVTRDCVAGYEWQDFGTMSSRSRGDLEESEEEECMNERTSSTRSFPRYERSFPWSSRGRSRSTLKSWSRGSRGRSGSASKSRSRGLGARSRSASRGHSRGSRGRSRSASLSRRGRPRKYLNSHLQRLQPRYWRSSTERKGGEPGRTAWRRRNSRSPEGTYYGRSRAPSSRNEVLRARSSYRKELKDKGHSSRYSRRSRSISRERFLHHRRYWSQSRSPSTVTSPGHSVQRTSRSRSLSSDRYRRRKTSERASSAGPSKSTEVVVTNLSEPVTRAHLIEIFGQCGKLKNVRLEQSRKEDGSRAFISYCESTEAENAVQKMHHGEIDGKILEVQLLRCQSDERRSESPKIIFRNRTPPPMPPNIMRNYAEGVDGRYSFQNRVFRPGRNDRPSGSRVRRDNAKHF